MTATDLSTSCSVLCGTENARTQPPGDHQHKQSERKAANVALLGQGTNEDLCVRRHPIDPLKRDVALHANECAISSLVVSLAASTAYQTLCWDLGACHTRRLYIIGWNSRLSHGLLRTDHEGCTKHGHRHSISLESNDTLGSQHFRSTDGNVP